MPAVIVRFVQATFVLATFVHTKIKVVTEFNTISHGLLAEYNLNRNYNLMGFDTIEIDLAATRIYPTSSSKPT